MQNGGAVTPETGSLKFIDAKQAKDIYHYKNIKTVKNECSHLV